MINIKKFLFFMLFFLGVLFLFCITVSATNLNQLVIRPNETIDTYQISITGAGSVHDALNDTVSDGNITYISNSGPYTDAYAEVGFENPARIGDPVEIIFVTHSITSNMYYVYIRHYIDGKYSFEPQDKTMVLHLLNKWIYNMTYWTKFINPTGNDSELEYSWTWDHVDDFNAGVHFMTNMRITQVYAVVKYVTGYESDVYVDDDYDSSTPGWNDTCFNKIQDAVHVCADGGTVHIASGKYDYKVVHWSSGPNDITGLYYPNYQVTVQDKTINIVGSGVDTCKIDNNGSTGAFIFHEGSDGSNLSNINITNYGCDRIAHILSKVHYSGICILASNITISNVNLYEHHQIGRIDGTPSYPISTEFYLRKYISYHGKKFLNVNNCTINSTDLAIQPTYGVLFRQDSYIEFEHCIFNNNNYGFWAIDCSNIIIRDCNFTIGEYGIGLFRTTDIICDNYLIDNNIFEGGKYPRIEIGSNTESNIGYNITVSNNYFPKTLSHAIWIWGFGGYISNNIILQAVYGNMEGAIEVFYNKKPVVICNNIINDTNKEAGIYIFNPYNITTIHSNYIENCSYYGIEIENNAQNKPILIYNNFFSNNDYHVIGTLLSNMNITKTLGTNILGGIYLGGNSWDNYTGFDNDTDGFGDTPYVLNGYTDYLPLLGAIPRITINCYNESNATQGLTFSVFITNQSGSETYYEEFCTNPHNLSYNDIPTGDKTSFIISSIGYYSRQIYLDIDPTINYIINVYLAPLSANYYFMEVYDVFNNPIEGVLLTVKRYMNSTGRYENMTSLYTDSVGQCNAYLLGGIQYKVFLNKTGYYDKIEDYVPDPNYYGIYYPKIFKIYLIPDNYTMYSDPWDYILFTAGFDNDTSLNIAFSDSSNNTNNAYILVFENMSNTSFYNWFFSNSSQSFTVPYNSTYNRPNHTKASYIIKLSIINHPIFGDFNATIIIMRSGFGNQSISLDIDIHFFEHLGGPDAGIGWMNFFIFGLLFFVFDVADKKRMGVSIALVGFVAIGITVFVGIPAVTVIQMILFAVYCIIIGAFIEIARVKRRSPLE